MNLNSRWNQTFDQDLKEVKHINNSDKDATRLRTLIWCVDYLIYIYQNALSSKSEKNDEKYDSDAR